LPHVPTVAIVDDDEAVREALGDLLMVSGLACHCFESAADFLDARATCHFDCLVTDIRMPGMSGIDLIERLRDEGSYLPVVALSSVLDETTRALALALGARTWLAKPVTDERLLGAISAAIGSAVPDARR
jgi:FixJ family two-component response regulator